MTDLPLKKRKSLSLRGHVYLYLAAMLGLILLLLGSSHYALQSTVNDLRDATEREFVEMRRMVMLRDVTQRTVEPIYRYMVWGNPAELSLFEQNSEEVYDAFADVLAMKSLSGEQRELVTAALDEWRRAANVGRAIFEIGTTEAEMPHLAAAGEIFEQHIAQVVDTLYIAHSIRVLTTEERQQSATERHETTRLVMLITFFGALMIFGIASMTTARHIILPLERIRSGISRIGNGELSHRITLDTGNELGDLAEGVNDMARRLEQDQDALEKMAIIDSLTGLYNRREFDRLLDEELHRARRYQHALSLLLIDIDRFKEVNDTFGHRVGDEALKAVSDTIQGISRKGDVVGRYGGDELAVLLPETPIEDAMILAERVRKRLTRRKIRLDDSKKLELTLSIGVAMISDEIIDAGQLVDAADRAMYLAKSGGRNRVRRNESQGGLRKAAP